MELTFSNTLIASDDLALGRVGAGASWAGEPIIDEAGFFREANATLFGRGDGPEQFAIGVWRFFNSEAEALEFAATHRASLPVQAALVLVNSSRTIALTMADAIRQVSIPSVRGIAVRVEYKFTGSRFTASEDVPDPEDTDDDGNDTMKLGVIDLDQDDESREVTFITPFGDVPRFVNPVIEAPGSSVCVGIAGVRNVTVEGFTAVFQAGIPASGYKLRWEARL